MSSLYSRIIYATRDELQTLGGLGIANIFARKQPRLAETDDLPAITISPGEMRLFDLHSEDTAQWIYPVYVTLWQASNGSLETALDTLLDFQEAIRRHFHKRNPLSSVSEIIDGEVQHPVNFQPALFDANYDVSQLELLFLSEEVRDDA